MNKMSWSSALIELESGGFADVPTENLIEIREGLTKEIAGRNLVQSRVGYPLSLQALAMLKKYGWPEPVSMYKHKLELGCFYKLGGIYPFQDNDMSVDGIYQYKEMYLPITELNVGLTFLTKIDYKELDHNGFFDPDKGWLIVPLDRLYVLEKMDYE